MSLHSTSPSHTPQRRLSTRRGSASALDPFNVHAELNHNPNRTSSSTLTIVRVALPQAPPPSFSLHEPPTSPVLNQRRLHRRPGCGTANPPASTQPPAESNPPSTRLSFAFSSFSGSGPAPGGPSTGSSRDRAPSPSSSPRLRPSSPRLSASSPFSTKPRLTPDQLVDLAHQSTSPRGLAQAATTPHSVPTSPVALSHSPVLSPHSPSLQAQTQATAPATFTPLPDDIYLPFIDRLSEVASLISSPPDAKLFTLLAQTFGNKKDADPNSPLEQRSDLPTDPSEWTYRHLVFHLTKVDRDVAPDPIWTYAARKCIISHSELIWERVKGALGIPPELDIDWDFNRDNNADSDGDSIRTDEISDDEGRAARGHWSDWDAIMDSPVYDRKNKRLSVESTGVVGYEGGNISPPQSTRQVDPENQVVIEPLVAPLPSFSSAPPPLSLPLSLSAGPSDGLGDIAEGAEEEEEETGVAQSEASLSASGNLPTQAQNDLNALLPSQIQGLKISTAPLPVNHYDTPPLMSPVSPVATAPGAIAIPGVISHTTGSSYVGSKPHSRSGSFSSIGPFKRSESTSSIAALLSSIKSANPGAGSDTSSILSDLHLGSDMIGDYRTAGAPLFPSNFARLASAPTLKSRWVYAYS
ncbi:hypothetical protein P691DRAFT_809772 [Macrolepiota fuliginosa MF-IS2]|uniref:Uncharacterized protein n=1 Tax=Macrolepiota fuliginosa MF-IS2 TaxID=1400762 RepID=A0A9P6C9Q3_9AGAR|nr:hypothetical protein P691DRAFT_809772 [Macrolepiota fuliginosa MF-IS2]